jgi:hypothetical protein
MHPTLATIRGPAIMKIDRRRLASSLLSCNGVHRHLTSSSPCTRSQARFAHAAAVAPAWRPSSALDE